MNEALDQFYSLSGTEFVLMAREARLMLVIGIGALVAVVAGIVARIVLEFSGVEEEMAVVVVIIVCLHCHGSS